MLRVAVLALALLATSAPALAPGPPGCAPILVEGVGLTCPAPGGLLEVLAPDGSSLGFTHGPDPDLPAPRLFTSPIAPLTTPRPPVCVSGAPGSYHTVVIYARAADGVDNYAGTVDDLRGLVARANGLVHDAAVATGGASGDLLVKCGAGVVEVRNEVLPTPGASANFGSIVRDLRAKGYTDGHVKHWVFYDDTGACSCSGTGHIYGDDRPGPENLNNGNGVSLFAVTFGRLSVRVWLHELGHNLGAVQNSAPHSTGGFHCTDGFDIMCYRDGGPNSNLYLPAPCVLEVFDCLKDDYFHRNPLPGSYLATHWNLASGHNRFVRYT